MRVPTFIVTTALAMMAGSPLDAAGKPALGDPAPPLQLAEALQVPADETVSLEGLRGKAVVIEFWSTWCPPCVKAIPHLNELAERLEGEPIRFLSITEEPREKVERFLERQPIKGWIGLDRGSSTASAYGRDAMPMTVLVDGKGRVQSIANPRDLTEESLRTLIAGQRPDLPQWRGSSDVLREMMAVSGGQPIVRLFLRPSSTTGGSMQMWEQVLAGAGMTLSMILQQAYDLTRARIIGPEDVLMRQYDFLIHAPSEALRDKLTREVVEQTLGLRMSRETRETDVYLLKAGQEAEKRLRTATEQRHSSTGRPGRIEAGASSMESLAGMLEVQFGRPVLDETGVSGEYEILLTWDTEREAGLHEAVEAQLGLKLVPGRREVEVLLVEEDGAGDVAGATERSPGPAGHAMN